MRQSLMLLGRSGSGKTSVMETLCGSEVKNARDVQSFTRCGLEIKAKETFGFFSGEHNMQTCTRDLEDCVKSYPGIDVIGFVIRIGRFTLEEKAMIDIFLDVLGQGAFNYTIVIFTHLDTLKYDDVPLSEFLEESPKELQDLLSLCGGRYVGFDNTGSTAEKQGYARSLIEAMEALNKTNKSDKYTADMLEQAREAKLVKDQEKKKVEEENFRLLKEQMKHDIRTEVEAKISQELEDRRIAQDNPTRRFAEYYKESQQACGDHRIEKLEDNYDSEDNQGRNNTDGMRYSEDQARRRPEERCFPENQKQKPKTKPKPVHLKKRGHEKNKRLAEFKDDSERTRPRNSMPRRIFATLTQSFRYVTGKM